MEIGKLKDLKFKIKSFFAFIIYRIMMIFKIENNKIVVSNYYGQSGYSCNPKYIIEELLKTGNKYKIIWLIKDFSMQFPNEIIKVRFNSICSFYHLATSKIWIDSQRKPYFIKKRKNQIYIQTWHGCLGFKKIEMDAIDSYDNIKQYKKERFHDTKMIDFFLSGADWFSKIIKNAFLYKGAIIPYGMPRNDILINHENIDLKKIKQSIGVLDNSFILLYAPTFRSNETDLRSYNLDYEKLISTLSDFYGKKVVLLLRLHPRLRKLSNLISFNKNVIDVTNFDDMQQLLLISDLLITDYSSCIFDFALQNKPGFIYASDIEDYRNDRDFYFDIFSLPFSVAETTEQLINNIKNFNYYDYSNKITDFNLKVGLHETGNSAKEVVKLIEENTK